MRSTRTIAALAAAFALTAVAPASAADDGWTVTSTQTQSGHTIQQSANGRILSSDADSETVFVDCKAIGGPITVAIGIKQCYMVGADGQRFNVPVNTGARANPGPVTMQSTTMVDIPRQRYRTCVQANAVFFDGFAFDATLTCTP